MTKHMTPEGEIARFWSKVDKTQDCWLWTGKPNDSGYGRFHTNGSSGVDVRAHRYAYELLVGPIPNGLDLDHLCRVRHCVNPGHLEPVTRRVNLLRGETIPAANAAKTHCARDHEFTPENTGDWRGARVCRACKAEDQRARRAA